MPTRQYAAFLRGISPLNAKMSELKTCFEAAGFSDVKTVLGTGNVVFSSSATSVTALERKIEAEMERRLGRTFLTIVRPLSALRTLVASDPYKSFRIAPGAKRVVTFLRKSPRLQLTLPAEVHGARILRVQGAEAFSVYVPGPRGPVFMSLIEKTFGKEITTRTWDTVSKVAK